MPKYATVSELRRAISTETLVAAGVPRDSHLQSLLRPLVWAPAHRFASLAAEFDHRVALQGFTAAARWATTRFVESMQVYGAEHIPPTGPLLVASNHPGAYDGLVIAAALARDDLKVLASDVPFFRGMYATSPHFIYTDLDPHARMVVVRESERHLRAGGSLLVFASAQVDPDPAFLPGAEQALQEWSSSLSLFLRRVPETKILVTITSGVLSPACFRHPLTRLRKEQRLKQFLAEFIQISQQVLIGRRFGLTPTVRFAKPLTAVDLDGGRDAQATLAALVARARALLAEV